MSKGFGRHFTADLYFCQNEIWRNPQQFYGEIARFSQIFHLPEESWKIWPQLSEQIIISGESKDMLVLIQVFPGNRFLALDIFCWELQTNIDHFSEGLADMFAPQVVAAETRLRAEHLN